MKFHVASGEGGVHKDKLSCTFILEHVSEIIADIQVFKIMPAHLRPLCRDGS